MFDDAVKRKRRFEITFWEKLDRGEKKKIEDDDRRRCEKKKKEEDDLRRCEKKKKEDDKGGEGSPTRTEEER